MYTITQPYQLTQDIKKSEFICYLIPVYSVEDASLQIKKIKDKHSDATHNCYAYIIGKTGEIAKSSDDGEPAKTAGIPMYEVLKKNNLTNVLAVVTRYFGGIKLGAGGLVRAYSGSVAKLINSITLTEIIETTKIELEFSYIHLNDILKLCNSYIELYRNFTTNIVIQYEIPTSDLETLKINLISKTNGSISIKEI